MARGRPLLQRGAAVPWPARIRAGRSVVITAGRKLIAALQIRQAAKKPDVSERSIARARRCFASWKHEAQHEAG
jgi:hypothetical protein